MDLHLRQHGAVDDLIADGGEQAFSVMLRQDATFIGFLGYDQETVRGADGEDTVVLRLQHTIIDEQFGRRGFARALVTMVLDRLRAEGDRIVPECSYVEDYLRRYPEYQDMVFHG